MIEDPLNTLLCGQGQAMFFYLSDTDVLDLWLFFPGGKGQEVVVSGEGIILIGVCSMSKKPTPQSLGLDVFASHPYHP